jgi:sugar/nucleoside kinase (ribokinase family)
MESGVSSFVITNGAENLLAFSNGEFFRQNDFFQLPVSSKVKEDLQSGNYPKGDTTGCGDNFAGGMIASIARQLKNFKPGELDLLEALALGTASGGFTCFYKGGTYLEKFKGEKAQQVQRYYEDYLNNDIYQNQMK